VNAYNQHSLSYQPVFQFTGYCQKSSRLLHESTLHQFELESLMKVLAIKEVLPPYVTVSHIRTCEDMCKYLLFPFMQLFIPPSIQDQEATEVNSLD